MAASRVRMRYRPIKGGHQFLVLVHYARGILNSLVFFLYPHFHAWHLHPFNSAILPAVPPDLQA